MPLANIDRQLCGTKAPCEPRTGTCAGMAAYFDSWRLVTNVFGLYSPQVSLQCASAIRTAVQAMSGFCKRYGDSNE